MVVLSWASSNFIVETWVYVKILILIYIQVCPGFEGNLWVHGKFWNVRDEPWLAYFSRAVKTKGRNHVLISKVPLYLVCWHWDALLFKQYKVYVWKKRMILQLMMPPHTKAVFWIYLQKRINQRSQIWIRNLIREYEFTGQYLVEHCLVTVSLERSYPARHLIKNNAQCP